MAEYPARFFGITSSVSGLSQGLIANSLSFNQTVESAEQPLNGIEFELQFFITLNNR